MTVPIKFDSFCKRYIAYKLLSNPSNAPDALLLSYSLTTLLLLTYRSMSSLELHAKISVAEAIQWIENAKDSWKEGGFPEDHDELCQVCADLKPVDFKAPRKPRVSKPSSSVSDRAEAEYDESKCDGAVWLKGGYRAQCSCKKGDDQFLCKRHQNEADKHDGKVRNGMINADRPTHPYDDNEQAILPWHDVVIEKKPKEEKKSSSGERKPRCCGNCGQAGHTKPKCPQLTATTNATPLSAAQLREMLAQAESAESAQEQEQQEQEKEQEEQEDLVGAGVGDLDTDTTIIPDASLVAAREAQQEKTESLVSTSSFNDSRSALSDMIADETEETQDESVNEISIEGVAYTVDDENHVFDDECDCIGDWDGSTINFGSHKDKKLHESAKKML